MTDHSTDAARRAELRACVVPAEPAVLGTMLLEALDPTRRPAGERYPI